MNILFKSVSTFGMLSSIVWFAMYQDFAAVLLGILSLSGFMLTLLFVQSADEQGPPTIIPDLE
ncbi:MAG: hypothetical protein REI95_01300 [Oxalicibacterium faecigallinarum]|uniref:Uncharacterized protein n=1 Tax=Oxalicibacterium faecigallinarum TaxID=573741 RepID=A0A8J3AY40_9BURK|nr:hypothetical protein [Oxalicibacterium faecigallinarum]MDQ7968253.1 hypothetical protein [Oxalicibacterium faecigallinarum]GGI19064.1 hypothetical protein GCM10008066_17210 [Oxalicibacterium faecigallinarum]